jgi:hypothetical protein
MNSSWGDPTPSEKVFCAAVITREYLKRIGHNE